MIFPFPGIQPVCVCISVYTCLQWVESSSRVVCVLILSLLLLQPQPSLIISSEKVTYVPELLLSVTTQHPQCAEFPMLSCNDFTVFIACCLNIFPLNAFLLVLFIAFAITQGRGGSALRVISLAIVSFGPCLAINNHLLQRSFLQSSLCLSSQLSVSLLFLCLSIKIYILNVSSAWSCLSPSLPSPAFIYLCSRECVCVCVSLSCCHSAPALCCCVSAVEVILFSLLILSIAFSQEAAAGSDIGRTSSAWETQGGLQPITLCTVQHDSSCGGGGG